MEETALLWCGSDEERRSDILQIPESGECCLNPDVCTKAGDLVEVRTFEEGKGHQQNGRLREALICFKDCLASCLLRGDGLQHPNAFSQLHLTLVDAARACEDLMVEQSSNFWGACLQMGCPSLLLRLNSFVYSSCKLILGATLCFLGEPRDGIPHAEDAYDQLVRRMEDEESGTQLELLTAQSVAASLLLMCAYSELCKLNIEAARQPGIRNCQHKPGVTCQHHVKAAQVGQRGRKLLESEGSMFVKGMPDHQNLYEAWTAFEAGQWMLAGPLHHGQAVECFQAVTPLRKVGVGEYLLSLGAAEEAIHLLESAPQGSENWESTEPWPRLSCLMRAYIMTGQTLTYAKQLLHHFKQGEVHWQNGRHEEAVTCFKNCLECYLEEVEAATTLEVQAALHQALSSIAGTLKESCTNLPFSRKRVTQLKLNPRLFINRDHLDSFPGRPQIAGDMPGLFCHIVDVMFRDPLPTSSSSSATAPNSIAVPQSSHEALCRILLAATHVSLGHLADAIPHLETAFVGLKGQHRHSQEVDDQGLLWGSNIHELLSEAYFHMAVSADPDHTEPWYVKAAQVTEECSDKYRDPYFKLMEGSRWSCTRYLGKAFHAYMESVEMANERLTGDALTEFKVFVAQNLLIFLEEGSHEEAALRLLQDVLKDTKNVNVTDFANLIQVLTINQRFPAALKLMRFVDDSLPNFRLGEKGDITQNRDWATWQRSKISFLTALGDRLQVDDLASTLLEIGEEEAQAGYDLHDTDASPMESALVCCYNEALNHESAIAKLEELVEEAQGLQGRYRSSSLLRIYECRAQRYQLMGSHDKALMDLERALDMLDRSPRHTFHDREEKVARLYLRQAEVKLATGGQHKLQEAQALIDKARPLVRTWQTQAELDKVALQVAVLVPQQEARTTWGHVMRIREEGQRSALHAMAVQKRLGVGSESHQAWVSFLEGTGMDETLFVNEVNAMAIMQKLAGLVWAERARMRLFMCDKPEVSCWMFDHCARYAGQICVQAVHACHPNTAVILYSYQPGYAYFHAYVLFKHRGGEVVGDAVVVELAKIPGNHLSTMRNVEELVKNVRKGIHRRNEEPKAELALLRRILLDSVTHLLPSRIDTIDTLLFAPQGDLWLLPFAALYDEHPVEPKFLIQQTCVGIVPGLRALHRCFQRQHCFQQDFGDRLEKPFVAGNPVPMGCGNCQLPGAAEEAETVAKLLGVKATVGKEMTKEAVKQGFMTSRLVSIATHGYKGKGASHQGQLVMQQVDGVPDDEVLSGEEIRELDVRAGMVVLSACRTGDGKATKEGLFALSRAVLDAGAATTVASLWPVDDQPTKTLITGMLTKFTDGNTVVKALQGAMNTMIEAGERMSGWAAFVVLGSPTLTWPDAPNYQALDDFSWMTTSILCSQDIAHSLCAKYGRTILQCDCSVCLQLGLPDIFLWVGGGMHIQE